MPQFGKKKKIESGDSRGALCPLLANWAMLSILLCGAGFHLVAGG